jgi:hypothetical protein
MGKAKQSWDIITRNPPHLLVFSKPCRPATIISSYAAPSTTPEALPTRLRWPTLVVLLPVATLLPAMLLSSVATLPWVPTARSAMRLLLLLLLSMLLLIMPIAPLLAAVATGRWWPAILTSTWRGSILLARSATAIPTLRRGRVRALLPVLSLGWWALSVLLVLWRWGRVIRAWLLVVASVLVRLGARLLPVRLLGRPLIVGWLLVRLLPILPRRWG